MNRKKLTKIFRDYFFLRESTVFYLDDGIFHSKNDVKDNKKKKKHKMHFTFLTSSSLVIPPT